MGLHTPPVIGLLRRYRTPESALLALHRRDKKAATWAALCIAEACLHAAFYQGKHRVLAKIIADKKRGYPFEHSSRDSLLEEEELLGKIGDRFFKNKDDRKLAAACAVSDALRVMRRSLPEPPRASKRRRGRKRAVSFVTLVQSYREATHNMYAVSKNDAALRALIEASMWEYPGRREQ